MKRSWLRSVLQGALLGGLLGIVEPAVLHRIWWDRHPGSQGRFQGEILWYLLGAMSLVFAGYLVKFYIQEYWHIFVRASQEEHNGIQR